METTTLKRYFQFIEIDNDVDLGLFSQFEKEMERMHSILPKAGDTLPELRLRKLGNHHALGLYVPQKIRSLSTLEIQTMILAVWGYSHLFTSTDTH